MSASNEMPVIISLVCHVIMMINLHPLVIVDFEIFVFGVLTGDNYCHVVDHFLIRFLLDRF